MKLSTLSAALAAGTILALGAAQSVSAHPDYAYGRQYMQQHHQSVLTSDFAHRYRYYHGHFPKTEDANFADRYQKSYHKSIFTSDFNHRYRYYHGHYYKSTKK